MNRYDFRKSSVLLSVSFSFPVRYEMHSAHCNGTVYQNVSKISSKSLYVCTVNPHHLNLPNLNSSTVPPHLTSNWIASLILNFFSICTKFWRTEVFRLARVRCMMHLWLVYCELFQVSVQTYTFCGFSWLADCRACTNPLSVQSDDAMHPWD